MTMMLLLITMTMIGMGAITAPGLWLQESGDDGVCDAGDDADGFDGGDDDDDGDDDGDDDDDDVQGLYNLYFIQICIFWFVANRIKIWSSGDITSKVRRLSTRLSHLHCHIALDNPIDFVS